jgi:hypothetical protein
MTARSIRRAIERKAKKLEKKGLIANQANAQLSTVPKTAEGKTNSLVNAASAQGNLPPVVCASTGTALTGRTVLLPADEIAEYERHLNAYVAEFEPVGLLETNLVQSIADTDWRLRRIPALESALFAKGRVEFVELFNEQDLAARPHLIDAHTFISYERQIRNLQLQEARLARRREKEIAELRSLQAGRIQKQQNQKTPELPANGFVFSTPQIEHAAMVQDRYHEPAALNAAAPASYLLTPVSRLENQL